MTLVPSSNANIGAPVDSLSQCELTLRSKISFTNKRKQTAFDTFNEKSIDLNIPCQRYMITSNTRKKTIVLLYFAFASFFNFEIDRIIIQVLKLYSSVDNASTAKLFTCTIHK